MIEITDVTVPLKNPVPGAWIQLTDSSLPPVYVPHEPQFKKDEKTGKDKIVGYAPGAHIKRLLNEGAMYANVPSSIVVEQPTASEREAALQDELERMKAAHEQAMQELAEIRAKMASDPGVPNAARKAR